MVHCECEVFFQKRYCQFDKEDNIMCIDASIYQWYIEVTHFATTVYGDFSANNKIRVRCLDWWYSIVIFHKLYNNDHTK